MESAKAQAQETILQSDLCANLSSENLETLLTIAQMRTLGANREILAQGGVADAVYLPINGYQLVERSGSDGRRQVLAFLQCGDYLGISAGQSFLYSAYTLTPSTILRFPASRFFQLVEELPILKDNLGRISSQILLRVIDHLFAIGQKRAHARLAFLLWQLWQRLPEARYPQRELELPMRRADIGDYLGLTLETTSRAFSRLRSEGVIATRQGNQVEILDMEALRRLAEVD
ncbi:MAG: helix-turn-helix domain-containing protein [Gammaproteobacteria bacterium]|nr:helix-turn-helix domain-containing protein [Gammaproteobacteria bacterium]MCY4357020.1 helix-turn-helix domain-containing protein [Gammaproteobacteria bacterium]